MKSDWTSIKFAENNLEYISSPSQSNAWKPYFVFRSKNVHSSTPKGTVRNLKEKVKLKMK